MFTSEKATYQDYVDALNHYGGLSTSLLARKFKVSIETAKKVLDRLVLDHKNVYKVNECRIFIIVRDGIKKI